MRGGPVNTPTSLHHSSDHPCRSIPTAASLRRGMFLHLHPNQLLLLLLVLVLALRLAAVDETFDWDGRAGPVLSTNSLEAFVYDLIPPKDGGRVPESEAESERSSSFVVPHVHIRLIRNGELRTATSTPHSS